jgi:serine/threonine-protein kinase
VTDRLNLAGLDWATLRRLLADGLDRAPAEREAWLDTLDPAFAPYAARLRALLAHAADPSAPALDGPPALTGVETGQFAAPPGQAGADERVGPYRLLREIGSGGMGSVWLAERTDMLHGRKVALKLPHGAWRRAGLAERMAREREILAALEHPNIARLYDAGVDADGQPWLALEYIDGERIDLWCEHHGATIEQRVRLLVQAARAVAHAHAQLVVHRDLKPANLLVTRDGTVKLLDFGIAKLLEEGVTKETELTQRAGRALTPDYAAPEQILGRPIGTAADVYALGVVLYELLAGQRPYTLARDSRAALEEAIVQVDPPRPSAVAPAPRRRTLRGDLDTVVLKALKKDPRERYASAESLADDLERHLQHLPVLARPDSRGYRLGRFVQRHRVGVASATLVALAVLAGTAGTAWQLSEAIAQRDRALYEQRRADAGAEFTDRLLTDVGRADRPRTLADVLDHATSMLESQRSGDPRVRMHMLYEASERYGTLGKRDRQGELLDRVVAGALEVGDLPLYASAQCQRVLHLLDSDRAGADRRWRETLQRAGRSTDDLWRCQRTLAAIEIAEGRAEAAIATLRQALARPYKGARLPAGPRHVLLSELGHVYYTLGRTAEALAATEEAIEVVEAGGLAGSMTHVIALMNLAAVLSRAGEVADAAARQEQALAIVRQVEGEGRVPVGFNGHLASSLLRLAKHEEALHLARAELDESHAAGNTRSEGLSALIAARALGGLGRFDEATASYDRAEALLGVNAKANRRHTNEIDLGRANQLLLQGRAAEAGAVVDKLLTGLDYPARRHAPGLSSALHTGASVRLALGDAATAERWAADAHALSVKGARDPKRSADVGQAAFNRARALALLGRTTEALTLLDESVESLRHGFGDEHPETVAASALRRTLASVVSAR